MGQGERTGGWNRLEAESKTRRLKAGWKAERYCLAWNLWCADESADGMGDGCGSDETEAYHT